MKTNQLITKVKSYFQDLTTVEKNIANFIMDNPEKVMYMTVSELASASKVSDASVIRFARDLGFDSFQQLKIALARERESSNISDEDAVISKDDSTKDIVDKTKLSCVKAIDDTSAIADLKSLENAARSIFGAKRVEVYGVGTSAAVAMVIQYKLIRIGIPCKAYDDPHIQAMSASTMNFGDVVIGVSHTGSTKDTVDSIKIAKEHGAFVISITDHPKSPIARYSDIVLETFSRETPVKSGAGRSIVAQIFLIETIIGLLYSIDPQKTQKYGEQTAKAVSDKLY